MRTKIMFSVLIDECVGVRDGHSTRSAKFWTTLLASDAVGGCTDCIPKPFDLDQVLNIVNKVFIDTLA